LAVGSADFGHNLGRDPEPDPSDRTRRERSVNPHERPVVTEDNNVAVRAGSTGNNVRYVLIASCALVIVAFIIIALSVRP
jgi:hypothetical protein